MTRTQLDGRPLDPGVGPRGQVLVTGATGYIASRLIPRLIGSGARVRVTSRNPSSVGDRHPTVEAVASDLTEASSLPPALEGITTAYYLVHSMATGDYQERDRTAARSFLAAAQRAGVERIVYLSGLGRSQDQLSGHLTSRHEVGRILASGSIPVTEVRCAIVIGSGSVAFDMLRYLTERLPAMIAPRWLETKIQPIAEDDLVSYLLAAGSEPSPGGVVEVGGADVLTYRQMIQRYAALRGLRRVVLGVPLLTPRLFSYWVQLITPVPTSVSRPLIDGLRNEVVVTDDRASERYPDVRPVGFDPALAAALDRQREILGDDLTGIQRLPGSRVAVLVDERRKTTPAAPDKVASVLGDFGADVSWYPFHWAWGIRGWLDGWIGRKKGREHPATSPLPWSAARWWEIERSAPESLLLRVRLRTPGEAWLAMRVEPSANGSELIQTAAFRPRGLLGRSYWWLLWLFHWPIFELMARRLGRRMDATESKT